MYQQLVGLTQDAFDLTSPEALNPARIRQYCCSVAGIDLLYATQPVNDEVLAGLHELVSQCKLKEQFRQMLRGAVMNRIHGFPSEERQFLHTACRDLFTENPVEPIASEQARREIARLKVFLDDLDNGTLANAQGHPLTL